MDRQNFTHCRAQFLEAHCPSRSRPEPVSEGLPLNNEVRSVSLPGSLRALLVTVSDKLPAAQIAFERSGNRTSWRMRCMLRP